MKTGSIGWQKCHTKKSRGCASQINGRKIYSNQKFMTKCTFDPTADIYKDAPIGMFHCPECGEMVVAGMPHPDWDEFYDEDEE